MLKWLATALVLACFSSAHAAQMDRVLLRDPAMSRTRIVFEYGGELWSVPRSGGEAHVLASGMDLMADPIFSPDGSQIAFSGTYDKNTDVYVIPASGGQPRRLTFHPDPDIAVGWTPDGSSVLFRSKRYSYSDPDQLFTVPATGGFPTELPLPSGETGSYSADGSHIAYVPGFQWEPYWKGYKGGQHTEIYLTRLSDSSTVRIPNLNSNENDPMWIGGKIYFLSDRDGPETLYAYDTGSAQVQRLIDNKGFDITSASAGPGGIVYSQFGQLHIYDFATGATHAVPVTVAGDLPQRRPYFADAAQDIEQFDISPTGVRAVFEAHGDILTVPAKHGSIENLTHSPGVMDRDPAWSPDGQSIAYFSDRAGEYDLYIRHEDGTGAVRRIALGQDDAFYYDLRWSPDSKKLLFDDQKLNLWYVDLTGAGAHPVKIATDGFDIPLHEFDARWSPDSRWITFTKLMPNYLHAIFIYSLSDGSTHQVTRGASDCMYPLFDRGGKYLYFTSSTNTGLAYGWLNMSSIQRPLTRTVYAATLEPDTASPLAPRAGFEEAPAGGAKTKEQSKPARRPGRASEKPPAVTIDFQGLRARAIPLPIPPADYVGLDSGGPGMLFLTRVPLVNMPSIGGPNRVPLDLLLFDLKTRKTQDVIAGITAGAPSQNGEKILYRRGDDWFIADARPNAKPDHLDLGDMRVLVMPHEQWAQMYRDAWRIQRAFFYNPTFDGLDLNAAEKEFANFLPGIGSRDGLTFLFQEMMSYESIGHMFVRGGYMPKMEEVTVGLLGANYAIEHGHYRITRIFRGGKWNPELYAPLAQPGLKVKAGDYLLAVNGAPIDGNINIYEAFQDLAGKTVTLTVGPEPALQGAHTITVKTIPDEAGLRHAAWIDHNIRLVDRLSGGKLAYVYLPDTAWGGYTNFNRFFFSQVNKQGVIIDERFNHGGDLSDYIIDNLLKQPMGLIVSRWGSTQVTPPEAIYGPKVMVINQYAGSGGDALPWYFKMAHVGTLVGERTWGGLVGIYGYPPLMDGGSITAPRVAVEGLNGTFPVENHGVSPEVTVWQDPKLVREGHDPQLERAVEVALQQLQAHPLPHYERAPWRDYHPQLPPLPKATSVAPQ
ncbi:MAG TPA: PDZ domain-containing protein [Steroidobacteraceae bacterium]|nr:PDZ domain-containing protein [Steroidobacteraceae bacterium]